MELRQDNVICTDQGKATTLESSMYTLSFFFVDLLYIGTYHVTFLVVVIKAIQYTYLENMLKLPMWCFMHPTSVVPSLMHLFHLLYMTTIHIKRGKLGFLKSGGYNICIFHDVSRSFS